MKKHFTLLFFGLFIIMSGYSQSSYSVLSNRFLLSALVNNDTLIIENIKNKVRINGEMGLLEVIYYNPDSRIVSGADPRPLNSEITFKLWNEYPWLEERLKSDAQTFSISDEILVNVQGEEESVPANFTFSRIRGSQGFIYIIEIQGSFSPEALKYDFPDLKFKQDLQFKIILNVQVTN